VGEIKMEKGIETLIGLRRELSDERREQIMEVLLVGVPEIEVKICHGSQSTVA
jgi:hypothetical protein